jgi:hypothetical protein
VAQAVHAAWAWTLALQRWGGRLGSQGVGGEGAQLEQPGFEFRPRAAACAPARQDICACAGTLSNSYRRAVPTSPTTALLVGNDYRNDSGAR